MGCPAEATAVTGDPRRRVESGLAGGTAGPAPAAAPGCPARPAERLAGRGEENSSAKRGLAWEGGKDTIQP